MQFDNAKCTSNTAEKSMCNTIIVVTLFHNKGSVDYGMYTKGYSIICSQDANFLNCRTGRKLEMNYTESTKELS